MAKGLIGKKIGMTTVFAEDGTATPVTVVEATPNLVFNHRTQDRDGYTAVVLAHEELDEKKADKRHTRPYVGQFKKKFGPVVSYLPSFDIVLRGTRHRLWEHVVRRVEWRIKPGTDALR